MLLGLELLTLPLPEGQVGVSLALSLVASAAPAQGAAVTIDGNALHQTIDGFGTAQPADATAWLYNWPEPQRSQILDLAFSQANGIGLTILRTEIMPGLEPSKGTWNYTDTEQVWVMKQAVTRGVTKLFASVWSPPAWMKTNHHVAHGGWLIAEAGNYQNFADYLSHYAGEYARANGVNVYAVSMANEPNSLWESWRSYTWTGGLMATFLSDYLSPTFAANHITAKVIAPETSRWDLEEDFLKATYNNPTATARLDLPVNFRTSGLSNFATPFITSGTQNLAPQPAVSLADTLTIPARSIASYVAPPVVSFHKPDGMILSTGNLYFTSHDAFGAHVFRMGQTSRPARKLSCITSPRAIGLETSSSQTSATSPTATSSR